MTSSQIQNEIKKHEGRWTGHAHILASAAIFLIRLPAENFNAKSKDWRLIGAGRSSAVPALLLFVFTAENRLFGWWLLVCDLALVLVCRCHLFICWVTLSWNSDSVVSCWGSRPGASVKVDLEQEVVFLGQGPGQGLRRADSPESCRVDMEVQREDPSGFEGGSMVTE